MPLDNGHPICDLCLYQYLKLGYLLDLLLCANDCECISNANKRWSLVKQLHMARTLSHFSKYIFGVLTSFMFFYILKTTTVEYRLLAHVAG